MAHTGEPVPDRQPGPALRRSLGTIPTTAQALATIGLTITAVINIPAALAAGSGRATWICYLLALLVIALVAETLVLFRHHPARASGIAAYVATGLGTRPTALASWALFLGYGAVFISCLSFFASYLVGLLHPLGLSLPSLLVFLLGGLLCVLLACCDLSLSALAMLLSEALSVLLVMALCALVLAHTAAAGPAAALTTGGRLDAAIGAGLMAAVFSFIGFESAATLGEEVRAPERSIPLALRGSVLVAGAIFLFWAVVLSEGLLALPPALRNGLDPVVALSRQLHWPFAGLLVDLGATLSLFATSLASLTAMGRIGYGLAQSRVLPPDLAEVHPRFQTPSVALVTCTAAGLLVGGGLELAGLTPQSLYDRFGGFAVLSFLLVYALVTVSALRNPLPGMTCRRRRTVASACLVVISAALVTDVASLLHSDPQLLTLTLLALGTGLTLVWARLPAGLGQEAG